MDSGREPLLSMLSNWTEVVHCSTEQDCDCTAPRHHGDRYDCSTPELPHNTVPSRSNCLTIENRYSNNTATATASLACPLCRVISRTLVERIAERGPRCDTVAVRNGRGSRWLRCEVVAVRNGVVAVAVRSGRTACRARRRPASRGSRLFHQRFCKRAVADRSRSKKVEGLLLLTGANYRMV